MSQKMDDKDLLDLIQKDRDKGISVLFEQYYSTVCQTIFYMIKDKSLSEDIGQDVFYEFWKKRDQINIQTSIAAYLKRSAVNKTLNHINKKKIKTDQLDTIFHLDAHEVNIQQELEAKELEEKIFLAIDQLAPKCRHIFMLSRYGDMKYQEIADQEGISIKTVENQISKALKILREELKSYLLKRK